MQFHTVNGMKVIVRDAPKAPSPLLKRLLQAKEILGRRPRFTLNMPKKRH